MKREDDFTCAACERRVSMQFVYKLGAPWSPLPPLCVSCERDYSRGVGKPSGGSYRDRRQAIQLLALSEALRCEAARQSWPEYREIANAEA